MVLVQHSGAGGASSGGPLSKEERRVTYSLLRRSNSTGAKAPKISMHLVQTCAEEEFLAFADLLGDPRLNIFLGLLWDNIVASSQRVL